MSQKATPAEEFAPCRHLTQPCQCDLQKTRNTTRLRVLRLPRKITMHTSKVLRLPRKLQHICSKRHKSIASATQNDFRHVPEHVWMSRSATPATRNEATRRLKPPKRTTYAKLPIGTAIRSSHERLRTVANGCGRGSNVKRTHPQPPDPQSETGTLATHSGKKTTRYTNSFSLFTHHKRDISYFLVVTPVWLPVVLPRCFTPVCNPIVLPRPCRFEVLDRIPVVSTGLSLPPVNEKWGSWLFFVCIHLANYFPKIIAAKQFSSTYSIHDRKRMKHNKCQLFLWEKFIGGMFSWQLCLEFSWAEIWPRDPPICWGIQWSTIDGKGAAVF